MTKKLTVIAAVATAAGNEATAAVECDKAMRGAIGNKRVGSKPYETAFNNVRHSYLVGAIAVRLGISHDKAAAVMDKATHEGTGKAKTGQSRRTKAEETAYGAARTALSRALSRAGIVSPLQHKREQEAKAQGKSGAKTGNRTKAGQGKAKAADKAGNVVPITKAKNREDAYGNLERMAATMLAYANKNAAVVNGEIGALVNRFKLELSSLIVGETK